MNYDACVCGYSCYAHLARHKKTCKAFQIHKLSEENMLLKQRNIELENRVNELLTKIATEPKTVINYNNNYNNYNILNIQDFNSTSLPNSEQVKRILGAVYSLDSAAESVPKYIKLKHFSNENTRNIRIPNVRGKTIQVIESDANGKKQWAHKDKKRMLEELTDTNLEELVDEYGATKVAKWREWYNGTVNKDGYDKTQEWKDLVNRVERALLDNRSGM